MVRTPKSLRLAVIAVAATVAMTVTAIKALMGPPAAQARQSDAARQPEGVTTVPSDPGRARLHPMAPVQFPPGFLRRAKFDQLDVTVARRQVTVFGKVEVYDTVPGNNYIWLLRIYKNDKRKPLLKEHHYLDQAVTLPEGEVAMSPTFLDTIELPPGSYKVELSMYAVPPGFRFNEVKFGEDMGKRTITKVSGLQKIAIDD